MTDERAIKILDPEHRENYESIEPVNEARRIGIAAIKRVKELEAENAVLKSNLGECEVGYSAALHYAREDNKKLQAENTALRERLDRAIETPCENGDIFYRFFDCPIEMVADMAWGFRKDKDGEIYVSSAYSGSWYNIKECEFSRKAAEARLKGLQRKE